MVHRTQRETEACGLIKNTTKDMEQPNQRCIGQHRKKQEMYAQHPPSTFKCSLEALLKRASVVLIM